MSNINLNESIHNIINELGSMMQEFESLKETFIDCPELEGVAPESFKQIVSGLGDDWAGKIDKCMEDWESILHSEKANIEFNNPVSRYTCVEASTANITENDADLLKKDDCPVSAIDTHYGYIIYLVKSLEEKDIEEYGLSKDFIRLFVAARETGARMLNVDCDAMPVEGAVKHDW
jgi:hypothetical protein